MRYSKAVKKNISCMQVLKTLELLLSGDYTMSELVQLLNEGEHDSVFNNNVVSKYINTCRYCGIDIPKIQNRYYVANLPFGLNLDNKDIDLINKMQVIATNSLSKKMNKNLTAFINKLNKFSNKKILRVTPECIDRNRDAFEEAVAGKRKISLMFRNQETITAIPLAIVENNGRSFFNVIINDKERLISSDRLSGFQVLEEKFYRFEQKPKEVIFKLKGNLAKRYSPRENEVVLDTKPDCIIVSNLGENKDILLSRLLRYDTLCEIQQPIEYKQEMKDIINGALANYGV